MGCNAWNHPPNCACGWGGDTGCGGYLGSVGPANGRAWSNVTRPTLESYVNPNALCPVCGDKVFFFQSELGGRVFFDRLGPPWPKHPCTDKRLQNFSGRSASAPSIVAAPIEEAKSSTGVSKHDLVKRTPPTKWRPLVPAFKVEVFKSFVRVVVDTQISLGLTILTIPIQIWCGAPIYWRWSKRKPGFIDISTLNTQDTFDIKPLETSVPGWAVRSDPLSSGEKQDEPSPERWNTLGWHFSFQHIDFIDSVQERVSAKTKPLIDWKLAKACFEKAAMAGHFGGQNNLGSIYMDGLGVPVNSDKAFQWFYQAAETCENKALENLAMCYREGIGCARDNNMADFLIALKNLDSGSGDLGVMLK